MITDDKGFISLPYVQGLLLSLASGISGLDYDRASFLRSVAYELRRLHEEELTRPRRSEVVG